MKITPSTKRISFFQVKGRTFSISSRPQETVAFTLLEVMIASAIFFMAIFSVLSLVSQSLKTAHILSQNGPTAGMVAAELSMTNQLEEGTESGDFGTAYPDYDWSRDVLFYASNGLFQVDIAVFKNGNVDSTMSLLMYRPQTTPGAANQPRRMFSR